MILKNLTSGDAVELSHDLLWIDEHSWTSVVMQTERTLTGAMVVDTSTAKKGRNITLQPPDREMAFHARSTVDTLRDWSQLPGQQFKLTLDDKREFNVLFRHNDTPALEANPVTNIQSFDPDSLWQIKLKFMEI